MSDWVWSLAGVQKLRSYRQRIWVAATASKGKASLFKDILLSFIDLYDIRNGLVHEGKTFIELEREPRPLNQEMSRILCLCIENIYEAGYSSASEHRAEIMRRLSRPEFEVIASAHPWAKKDRIKFPVGEDSDLKNML